MHRAFVVRLRQQITDLVLDKIRTFSASVYKVRVVSLEQKNLSYSERVKSPDASRKLGRMALINYQIPICIAKVGLRDPLDDVLFFRRPD